MDKLAASWSLPAALGWLALVRVWVGVIWAWQGLEMFWTGDFRDLTKKLTRMADANPHPCFAAFLTQVVLPQVRCVSPLVAAGQLAVGLGLLFGVLDRLAAAAGILMNVNFYLAASHNFPCNRPLNLLMIGLQAILILGGAGRSLSLAALLP